MLPCVFLNFVVWPVRHKSVLKTIHLPNIYTNFFCNSVMLENSKLGLSLLSDVPGTISK